MHTFMTHFDITQFNQTEHSTLLQQLAHTYKENTWVIEQALNNRPFASLADFKQHCVETVNHAPMAKVDQLLASYQQSWQTTDFCPAATDEAFNVFMSLVNEHDKKFHFPFILALTGLRNRGMTIQEATRVVKHRMNNPVESERIESIRQIHRMAETAINQAVDYEPRLGNATWDGMEQLSQFTDTGYEELQQLTITYMTESHKKCAQLIAEQMRTAGFDRITIDPLGNVIGHYLSDLSDAKTLMTGSHYDTVRNAGKYDGRLGIYVPITCVAELKRNNKRLPYHLEVVAFAEEEGQRFKSAFLGSSALAGVFDPDWLSQEDANGITMAQVMADNQCDFQTIQSLKRNPDQYLGFVEVHIEQGPVLWGKQLPLGIVTSINGNVRYNLTIQGVPEHAGTAPMQTRRDAATAGAELILYIEERAKQDKDSVGTVGILQVPRGSLNVVPGRCQFSIDLRAPNDQQRDALDRDVRAKLDDIAERRGISYQLEEILRIPAAPSAPALQSLWEQSVTDIGLPLCKMNSGATHDAMIMHRLLPQAMLFVRNEYRGISHNPLESLTNDDAQIAVEAFAALLNNMGSRFM